MPDELFYVNVGLPEKMPVCVMKTKNGMPVNYPVCLFEKLQ